MKERKQYICEICGNVSIEAENIRRCEQSHQTPQAIIENSLEYKTPNNYVDNYPVKMLVRFPNGEAVPYNLDYEAAKKQSKDF